MKIREKTLLLIPLKHAICVVTQGTGNLKKIQKPIPVLFLPWFLSSIFPFCLSNLLITSFGFILKIPTPIIEQGLRILTIHTHF